MAETFTLYKLIVLYMLDRVDFPLTTSQISEFILDKGYTTYFRLQSALAELTDSGLLKIELTHNRTLYNLTEEGAATINYFRNKISPEIRQEIDNFINEKKYDLKEKEDFLSTRKGITDVSKFSLEERNAWIRQNPAYGTIVCRCEMVTEGEIIDAIRGPLGARSLDGVKRRTRAGMGRCQAGFCSPRVMEILARELGIPVEEITKSGGNSGIIKGSNKDSFGEDGK